ncbi:MAG: hypothetical protein ACOYJU_02425 [Anaerovoracaceae bacterium]|jgi:hypothetical protein
MIVHEDTEGRGGQRGNHKQELRSMMNTGCSLFPNANIKYRSGKLKTELSQDQYRLFNGSTHGFTFISADD